MQRNDMPPEIIDQAALLERKGDIWSTPGMGGRSERASKGETRPGSMEVPSEVIYPPGQHCQALA